MDGGRDDRSGMTGSGCRPDSHSTGEDGGRDDRRYLIEMRFIQKPGSQEREVRATDSVASADSV